MQRTNEDNVTRLLSMSEILDRSDLTDNSFQIKQYSTNPEYDLSLYLASEKNRERQYKDKYIFVK